MEKARQRILKVLCQTIWILCWQKQKENKRNLFFFSLFFFVKTKCIVPTEFWNFCFRHLANGQNSEYVSSFFRERFLLLYGMLWKYCLPFIFMKTSRDMGSVMRQSTFSATKNYFSTVASINYAFLIAMNKNLNASL